MATDLNRVMLYGRVVGAPELSIGPDKQQRARFVFETRNTWKDRATGEPRSTAEQHDIVVSNHKLAGIVAEHVVAGTRLFLEGGLHSRWTRGGADAPRRVVEVVLGPFKSTLGLLDEVEPQE